MCSHRVRHFLQRLLLARAASPSVYRRTLARSAGRSSVAPTTTTVSPLVVRSRLAPISGLLKLNETRARGATNRDVRARRARAYADMSHCLRHLPAIRRVRFFYKTNFRISERAYLAEFACRFKEMLWRSLCLRERELDEKGVCSGLERDSAICARYYCRRK